MKIQARNILEVNENASFDQIRSAWIKYMFKNHPDLNNTNPDATNNSMLGNECYSILTGEITEPSCLKIPKKDLERKIASVQQYTRQFGKGIWNY